jgi:hypothetical protein
MVVRYVCLLAFCFAAFGAQAQTGVTIHDQAGAGELIERHIFFNKEHGELPGYRIQVYAGTSLSEAKDQKSGFLQNYDIAATIIFEAPNYKVRVGNYTNRFDANRDLMIVKNNYSEALIVKDLIRISE